MKKPKYTAEVHQRIVTAIRDGATQRAAARRVGVTPESLSIWKRKFPAFGEDVERGHAEAQVRAETSLYKLAVKGNVRALQAWLQARRPEDWQPRVPTAPAYPEHPVLQLFWPHELEAQSDSGSDGLHDLEHGDRITTDGHSVQLRQVRAARGD